jgi:vacuolar protein sorting-associated protein 72
MTIEDTPNISSSIEDSETDVIETSIPMVLQRSRRANAGHKMKQLLEEELEIEDDFYRQELFQEEEDDIEYIKTETEESSNDDILDDDFLSLEDDEDMASPNPEQEEKELLKEEKKRKKKHLKTYFKEPSISSTKQTAEPSNFSTPPPKKAPQRSENIRMDLTRSVRDSTLAKTHKTQVMTEALERLKTIRSEEFAKRKPKEPIRWTQEALLEEAKQTEILNLASLKHLEQMEIEKKKVHQPYVDLSGPRIIYRSSLETGQSVEFKNWIKDPLEDLKLKIRIKRHRLCVVTGLPAKYREAATGLPYATLEAYHQLRDT